MSWQYRREEAGVLASTVMHLCFPAMWSQEWVMMNSQLPEKQGLPEHRDSDPRLAITQCPSRMESG